MVLVKNSPLAKPRRDRRIRVRVRPRDHKASQDRAEEIRPSSP